MVLFLVVLGSSLVLVGPILFIVARAMRHEKARKQQEQWLITQGSPVAAQLLTIGQSPAHGVYPKDSSFLRLEFRLLESAPGAFPGATVVIDQAIPKVLLGAFTPGSSLQLRVGSDGGALHSMVDLHAMGFRRF